MCAMYNLATVNGLDMRSVYNTFSNKNVDANKILDTLHVKCKNFTYESILYNVLKYNKSLMSDDVVTTTGLFRSVIVNDGNILAFSPPKSVQEVTFINKYSDREVFAEEFIEGTMINVFWVPGLGDNGDWEISTRSGVGGRMTYFQNGAIRAEDTFRYMFLDACSKANLVFDNLNRKYCYTFVFQHPQNRIVTPFYETNLYLVGAYNIDNDAYTVTEVPRQEQIDMVVATKVKIPKRFDFDCYDELRATWACGNTDYKTVGIMLKNKTNGERSKMRNPNYETVRQLRGNQPKLQYHYIALRQQGKVGEYLKYFGEAKKPFSEFREHIHTFTNQLHQNYIDCYVKKKQALVDYPAQYKPHMYSLHEKYLKELRSSGRYITRRYVVDYVNGLPPARLMFTLNFSMRKRQVEEHAVDMVAE